MIRCELVAEEGERDTVTLRPSAAYAISDIVMSHFSSGQLWAPNIGRQEVWDISLFHGETIFGAFDTDF